MKWKILFCCFFCLIILVACFCRDKKFDGTPAVIHYERNGIQLQATLSEEETRVVKNILGGKIPMPDNPSCGFSPSISIEYGQYTYAIAQDSCGILMIVETGKYIFISSGARERLERIFACYGATFPYYNL